MAVNYDPRYLTYDKDEVQRILAKAAESAPQSTTYTKEEVDELVGDKYQKPESGIPKTDLANGVQESLTNADNHEFQIDTLPTKGNVNKVEYIVPSQASRSQQVTSNSLEQTNVIGYAGHSAYRYPTGISVPAGCAVRIAASRKCMWLTNAAGMYKLERFGDFYVNQTQSTKTVYVAVAPTAGDLTLYYYDTPLVTVQEQLAQKQDPITDLDTIRTGAAAGATAYQKPSSGIPSTDLSSDVQASLNKAEAAAPQADTYTKAEVDEAIADIDVSEQLNGVAFLGDVEGSATADFDPVADTLHKGAQVLSASEQAQVRANINAQEKLVSGQNIATINGSRIDQGGNVTIVAAEGQTITIDAAPTAGSNNAVSSGGVFNSISQLSQEVDDLFADSESDFAIADEDGYNIVELKDGHIRTKFFDSSKLPINAIKKAVFMGDSITQGVYSFWNNDAHAETDRYNGFDITNMANVAEATAYHGIHYYFGLLSGAEMVNLGKRGTGWVADVRNLGTAVVVANGYDFKDTDFVALCFGVNDYIQGENIGDISTKVSGTIIGNMCTTIEKILTDNPLCKVVVYSPYNTWGQVSCGGNYTSNVLYGDEASNYALGHTISGHTLQDIIDAEEIVCDHYGIQIVNLSKSNVINRFTIKNILVDGLHPTKDSYVKLAAEIYGKGNFGA